MNLFQIFRARPSKSRTEEAWQADYFELELDLFKLRYELIKMKYEVLRWKCESDHGKSGEKYGT